MKKLLFLLLLLTYCTQGQNLTNATGSLRGFVHDSTSGETIAFANIVLKNTTYGAPSNVRGYYFVPGVPPGDYTAIISYVGYVTKYVPIKISSGIITELDIDLVPTEISMGEVSVIGEKKTKLNETDLGLQKISIKDIKMLPMGVESDIFRYLQASTGVSSTGDVTSTYYVRGGGSDQNLVLLNNATVYNPYHALGIFSVIDPEVISAMEFFKGGFLPQYGGRLSSVLNIITRDGNRNEFKASGSLSLLAGKASVEGPIPGGSFLVTGRKSYYSDILGKYLNGKKAPFDFYDLSFKVTYANPEIDKNAKFTVNGFLSDDRVINDDPLKEDYVIKNNIVGMSWRQVWGTPLFSVVNLSYSGFDAEVIPNFSDANPRKNSIHDISADCNFTYVYENRDELGFGVHSKIFTSDLQLRDDDGRGRNFSQSTGSLSLFMNYKFLRSETMGLDLGLRANLIGLSKLRPFLLEPRINFTYTPLPIIAFKMGFGRYSQEIITLTDENDLISIFEPWVVVPDYLNAPEATHFIAGVTTYLTDKISLDIEGYYKDIAYLVDLNEKKYSNIDNEYISVDGRSYGVEVETTAKLTEIYVKIAYSLAWAYKEYNNIDFYPRYDKRHTLSVLTNYSPGGGWQFSINWMLNSGMPFTPIVGFYDRLEIKQPPPFYPLNLFVPTTLWGTKNTERLPYYHRMDISVSKRFRLFAALFQIEASIMNVYNRKNIFYYNRDTGERVDMLPFMPTLSVRVEL